MRAKVAAKEKIAFAPDVLRWVWHDRSVTISEREPTSVVVANRNRRRLRVWLRAEFHFSTPAFSVGALRGAHKLGSWHRAAPSLAEGSPQEVDIKPSVTFSDQRRKRGEKCVIPGKTVLAFIY
jgi:hypothetical protein